MLMAGNVTCVKWNDVREHCYTESESLVCMCVLSRVGSQASLEICSLVNWCANHIKFLDIYVRTHTRIGLHVRVRGCMIEFATAKQTLFPETHTHTQQTTFYKTPLTPASSNHYVWCTNEQQPTALMNTTFPFLLADMQCVK